MDKENDLDLIIDYINDDLSSEQKIKFEERLNFELDLVDSLKIQKELHHAFVKIQTSKQVKSIHENAKHLVRAQQNKGIGFSKNFQETPSNTSLDIDNKAQADYSVLRKLAAVFISIVFIGGLWTWFNHESVSIKSISNYVAPVEIDSIFNPSSDKLNIEKNDSNQVLNEESYLKRIDIVQLNPDVSFGFANKNETSKKIVSLRIWNSSNGIKSMYRLNEDTLLLYVNKNSQSEEFLFEIQHDDDSQSTLENGFYLNLDNKFYYLNNNNKLNKLILLENKYRVSELSKLVRRK
jgi:hypothetical protein